MELFQLRDIDIWLRIFYVFDLKEKTLDDVGFPTELRVKSFQNTLDYNQHQRRLQINDWFHFV